MALASSSPPYPLLVDYLLASSWTWFAICLATIATSLRALLRHRLLTAPLPPSSVPPSISDPPLLFSSLLAHQPSPAPATPSFKSFQRRARSKSASCLERPPNNEDFLRSSVEFLSSVLDAELSPSLKKIASASRLFYGDFSCKKSQQNPWLSGSTASTNRRRSEAYDLAEARVDADECSGSRSVVGFDPETLMQVNEEPCSTCFKQEQPHTHEVLLSWLPSWAHSLHKPSQIKLPLSISTCGEDEGHDTLPAVEAIPFFEKQFGWDKLLESRLGAPWSSPAWCKQFSAESSNVVKMWHGQYKEFVKGLDVETLALDVCARDGVACTGNAMGKISLWELERNPYSKASVSLSPHPVVAVSMNPDQGAIVVGSSKGLGVWDRRSPNFTPLRCGSVFSTSNSITLSALKSRGSGLCLASNNNTLSMYDLRMPLSGALCCGLSAKKALILPDSDDEADANLLERFTCDDDDDDEFWDESCEPTFGNGVELQKSSSLLSKFTSFMKGL